MTSMEKKEEMLEVECHSDIPTTSNYVLYTFPNWTRQYEATRVTRLCVSNDRFLNCQGGHMDSNWALGVEKSEITPELLHSAPPPTSLISLFVYRLWWINKWQLLTSCNQPHPSKACVLPQTATKHEEWVAWKTFCFSSWQLANSIIINHWTFYTPNTIHRPLSIRNP